MAVIDLLDDCLSGVRNGAGGEPEAVCEFNAVGASPISSGDFIDAVCCTVDQGAVF